MRKRTDTAPPPGAGKRKDMSSSKEGKTEQFRVRLAPSEKAEIAANAEAAGLTMSDFVLRRALGRPVMSIADDKTINELRRIGGLLKHTHNLTGGTFSKETALALREITDAIKRVGRDREGGD